MKQTIKNLDFLGNLDLILVVFDEFEEIKTVGANARFLLSGITLRKIQGIRNGCGNFLYDPVNRLIGAFPYHIDTTLPNDVIIFEEKIDDLPEAISCLVNEIRQKTVK